jgi:hypothetical protein
MWTINELKFNGRKGQRLYEEAVIEVHMTDETPEAVPRALGRPPMPKEDV